MRVRVRVVLVRGRVRARGRMGRAANATLTTVEPHLVPPRLETKQ